MNTKTLLDKKFEIFIPADRIKARIKQIAAQINVDYRDERPVFLGILNGSFMFAADLFKEIHLDAEITFLKLSSYEGMSTTGKVKQLIGLNSSSVSGRHVLIIEDIVDTGGTLVDILDQIEASGPQSVKTISLLYKPQACKKDVPLDYIGFEIPDRFVLGYGLDYDGYGRNSKDIYILAEE